MTERKIPKLFQKVVDVPKTQEQASLEVARVENTRLNMCPICQNPLTGAKTNGLDVRVCLTHNIVMPCKD